MGSPRARSSKPLLLDGLGLIGMTEIEPVVIAAVAAELPILLVGPHGTGKSLLLTRIAEALGLTWRHYNASLLSYDDLVGYPVPDGRGGLDWLRTPATIWDAEAVFLDEINRCRPEIQNKLFPIVHERRVQGIELTRLRHRWSAMNPVGDDTTEDAYLGAEPLDAALADRFAFIVPMPDWRALAPAEQERLLLADMRPVDTASAEAFRLAVSAARARYLAAIADPDPASAVYVRHALRLLDDAGLHCSPRRGAMLVRGIAAVRASGLLEPGKAALAALRFGLPQRASGGKISEAKILAAHREALAAAGAQPGDRGLALRSIADRFERTVRALELADLDPALRSGVVADGLADLADGECHAIAVHAFEHGQADGLLGAVAAQLATAYALVSTPQGVHENITARGVRHEAWLAVTRAVSGLAPGPGAAHLENLLVGLWGAKRIGRPEDVARVRAAWERARAQLVDRAVGPDVDREAAA